MMRGTTTTAVALLLLTGCSNPATKIVFTEPEPVTINRPEQEPLRVLFAGDSLTGSYYAATEADGWRPLTVAAWEEGGPVEPVGVGVPHGRLSEVAADTIIPADAHLALIELGTNDYGHTPIDEFADQYTALLDSIEAQSPDTKFVCLGIWEPADDVVNGRPAAAYDQAIDQACSDKEGVFVRLAPIFDADDTRGPAGVETFAGTSDTFHPNNRGHRLIAEAVTRAVRLR